MFPNSPNEDYLKSHGRNATYSGGGQLQKKVADALSMVIYSSSEQLKNYIILIFLCGLWGCLHCGHSLPIVPASGDSEDDCGEADGM
jgi:hypothetical protein